MQNSMEMDLKNREWKGFVINEIFDVDKGVYLHSKNILKGNNPYITAKSNNNGINSFIGNTTLFKGNSITIEKVKLSAFYQPSDFYCSHDVTVITNKFLNQHNAKFICNAINRNGVKYNYGRQAQMNVVKREKIYLPTNHQGEPDYKFMEAFIKQKEKEKLKIYKDYQKKRIKEVENFKNVESITEKEFSEFEIEKIFNLNSGKRLTKADMIKGDKPFIGATDSNNGITAFVSNTNSSEDSNVLGVNYNGSVVENFYHPYTAIFSDDVKRLSFKEIEGNKHLFLFVKTQILKQKIKYQYGYKFNGSRMRKQKIMLPINSEKEPDYEYMENYMKKLEYIKLTEYLKKKIS
ncbi:restriction endonuclease subunit S [Tenacibaculum maritimum]|uniref:restriction endonuclease subunit S n=1 Tax=Tenacibaculum maritimum TaxID=107401 RepID=UPI003875CC29